MAAERIFTMDDHSFWQGQEDTPEGKQKQQENDNKWKDISEKMKTNLSTFSKSMGEKADDLLLQGGSVCMKPNDYQEVFKKVYGNE